jgi:D-glycero-D-manno-heptose 1,7-bisphosphate phosphatase
MDLSTKKLFILDRDGVINFDSPDFIKSEDEWLPIPGSLEAISLLNDAGKIVAVATNQSGIARGLFSEDTLDAMHRKMVIMAHEVGGHIDLMVHCPHGPNDNCACRKPKPGLVSGLCQHFSIEPEDAVLVGDSLRDLQAATSAGIDSVLVKTGKGEQTLADNDITQPVFANLLAVASATVPKH